MSDCKFDVQKIEEIRYNLSEQTTINNKQTVEIAELKLLAKQSADTQDKITKLLDDVVTNMTKNTKDLEIHIKRTDILQSRQFKIIVILAFALGAGLLQYGPLLFGFLK